MIKKEIIYSGTSEEIRIDKYLAEQIEEVSRTELKEYFNQGKIKVNDKIVKPSYKLFDNDQIVVEEIAQDEIDMIKENIPLDIVYEDDDLIVVNKPSGLVVHPAPGHTHGTLVNGLLYHCNELSNMNGDIRAGIVHRIDKDTSGLLVVCKNNYAHRILAEQLKDKTTTRTYIAIVTGNISHNLGRIEAPIGRDPSNRQKMAVVPNGKPSVTHFKVLDRYRDFTLVELKLETGRTHQIRVHMSYINHPVVGDPLYGVKKQTTEFGQYLHAKTLGFVHPESGEKKIFSCPLPGYFEKVLEIIRQKY